MKAFTIIIVLLVSLNLVISTCIPQNCGYGPPCNTGGCGGYIGGNSGCGGGCGGGCNGGCVGYGCGSARRPFLREDLRISGNLAVRKIRAIRNRIEKCKRLCGGLELELALAKGSLPSAELEIEASL